LSAYQLIDTAAGLDSATHALENDLAEPGAKRLYLDTEFESNRSGIKACLLQVSAGKNTYLIDTLALKAFGRLPQVLGLTSSKKRTQLKKADQG